MTPREMSRASDRNQPHRAVELMSTGKKAVYRRTIERLFEKAYNEGATVVPFTREDISVAAEEVGVDPKNIGDLVYYYRYRAKLPRSIRQKAGEGMEWLIRGAGDARYQLVAVPRQYALLIPRPGTTVVKILDSTPELIEKYRLNDEQALLAKLRYARLLDIFTGLSCVALQSHLRSKVAGIGQVEADEVYLGVDASGAHYVLPVQAKGNRDRHSLVQIEQDIALCRAKFPQAICRPIAAQFLGPEKRLIAMFSFNVEPDGTATVRDERHYLLVRKEELSDEEIGRYRQAAREAAVVDGWEPVDPRQPAPPRHRPTQ